MMGMGMETMRPPGNGDGDGGWDKGWRWDGYRDGGIGVSCVRVFTLAHSSTFPNLYQFHLNVNESPG